MCTCIAELTLLAAKQRNLTWVVIVLLAMLVIIEWREN